MLYPCSQTLRSLVSSKRVRRSIAFGLLVLSEIAFVQNGVAASPYEVQEGELLRDVQLKGVNTSSRRLSDYRGLPLVINVWASWCGPCRQEMSSLERLARSNQGRNFRVLGISTDDYFENAKMMVQRENISFPNYIDRELELEMMLGANKIPLTVLVDANGRVIKKIYGSRRWDSSQSIQEIESAIGQTKTLR